MPAMSYWDIIKLFASSAIGLALAWVIHINIRRISPHQKIDKNNNIIDSIWLNILKFISLMFIFIGSTVIFGHLRRAAYEEIVVNVSISLIILGLSLLFMLRKNVTNPKNDT